MPDNVEGDTSLREDLVAAFQSYDVSDTETGEPSAPEPVEQNRTDEPAEAKEPVREEAVAKPAEAKEGGSAEKGAVKAPDRWTKEEKEEFESLDPDVQRILLNRNKGLESSYTQKMQQISQERQRYHNIEQSLAPHRQTWAPLGWDDATAVQNIMGYWHHANQDPLGFIQSFAEMRGIDLAEQFAPSTDDILQYLNGQTGEGGQAAALHPDVKRQMETLRREQQQLQQAIQQQQGYISQAEQQRMQATRASAAQELHEFQNATDESGNLKHEFLDDLREDMSRLLETGMAQNLSEAYEKAMWSRPDIRSKVVESMQLKERQELERKMREEGNRARNASSSLSGSHVSPAPDNSDDEGDGSIRSILMNEWKRQARASDGMI